MAKSNAIAGVEPIPRPSRPSPPEISNIPAELKARRIWLVWRFSDTPNGKGKFGKVPFNIVDKRADFTNPAEWQLFETVMVQYERGGYDGVGLVLGNGLCGFDEDDCFQDGRLLDRSARHINLLDSYSEFSVLGDGVHCLALGSLPSGRRKLGNHELYDDLRFFVVTGRKLPSSPGYVAHRENELKLLHSMLFGMVEQNRPCFENKSDTFPEKHLAPEKHPEPVSKPVLITQRGKGKELSDDEVISRIKADRGVRRYWSGCPNDVNPSKADFALACKLAFYSGRNLPQMERLFRRSGLATRAKARTRRGSTDYISYTLRRAWQKQEKVWEPGRRAKTGKPPGRPRCEVNPEEVIRLKSGGESLRSIGRILSISAATAMRICNAHASAPKSPHGAENRHLEIHQRKVNPAKRVGPTYKPLHSTNSVSQPNTIRGIATTSIPEIAPARKLCEGGE